MSKVDSFLPGCESARERIRPLKAKSSSRSIILEPSKGSVIFTGGSTVTHTIATVQPSQSEAAVREPVKPLTMDLARHEFRVSSLLLHNDRHDAWLAGQTLGEGEYFEKETLYGRTGYPEELEDNILLLFNEAGCWQAE